MNSPTLLRISGLVDRPLELGFADLASLSAEYQIRDVSQIDPKRKGGAIRFAGLLALCGPQANARFLGLHSARDDFHASIPIEAVRDRAIVIYELDQASLPISAGGPVRFFIPDHAQCRTHEIDECANVKFVDHMELTADRGFDNRPHDEQSHADLHAKE